MVPIDHFAAPFRTPLGTDTTELNLFRRWRNQLLFETGWSKMYGPMVFGIVLLAAIIAFSYTKYSDENINRLLLGLLVTIFIFIRFYVAMIPALIIKADSRTDLWDHFRMTLHSGTVVFKAMFLLALNYAAIPIAILSIFETLYFISGNGFSIGTGFDQSLI
ncbi:MAG: hypothetical protein ABIC40_02485, partial [bacterium]